MTKRIVIWLRRIGLLALLPAFAVYTTEGTLQDHAMALSSVAYAVEAIPNDGYIKHRKILKVRNKLQAKLSAKRRARSKAAKVARKRNRSS